MPAPLSGRFNIPRAPGAPAIFSAVMNGDAASVKIILEGDSAQAGARDRGGNTPLMMAVIFGPERQEIIDVLVAHGADVNVQNRHGGNALARAAHFGHKDLVNQLLALGADASMKDARGQNAADWANSGGHPEIAGILETPGPGSKPAPPGPKP
jgi:hypothetical protein